MVIAYTLYGIDCFDGRWLKQTKVESADIGHLKRIKKTPERTTLLLNVSSVPPDLPADLHLGAPYSVPVPCTAALTQISLQLKSSIWPTLFAPRKKYEPKPWTVKQVRWARSAFRTVLKEATKALAEGEVCHSVDLCPLHPS